MDNSNSTKFNCPNCGHPITITLEVLLQGHIATCMNCNSQLKVNREQSQGALAALEKFVKKVQELKENPTNL